MRSDQPSVLSIAGFDPSNGAGITSDVKTFESIGVYGFSICTAITVQTEDQFEKCFWVEEAKIFDQLDLILKKYRPQFIKIGLIETLPLLKKVCERILSIVPAAKIVWDPILKSSSGFIFHKEWTETRLRFLLNDLYLITPNLTEWQQITGVKDWLKPTESWVMHSNLFIKSIEEDGNICDYLLTETGRRRYDGNPIDTPKHGSGCVLAAAICAHLALGAKLEEACEKGRNYCSHFLESDDGLLGRHNFSKS